MPNTVTRAFSVDDYFEASASAFPDDEPIVCEFQEVEAQGGQFDLRGFEIARSQFFNTAQRLSVTMTDHSLMFSTECVRKFETF